MKEIRGHAKSIRALLGGVKFAIDYYQREYRWGRKQVSELLTDLSEAFQASYEAHHERKNVAGYGIYFLGSIIISDKDSQRYIIDGQQRLTSLTLLLIYIYRNLTDTEQQGQLADLIFTQKFGDRSFNIHVPERTPCMDALFKGQIPDAHQLPESVANILSRYGDIEADFPPELQGAALPFFADWLIENVYLVEITAYSDADAYTIFETMNDRGLSLTPTEMLKGYLLANINDADTRNTASETWRRQVAVLKRFGKDEDADAIKSWLRSQHAATIRERKRDAKPRDFDRIGTEFHRWVRENENDLSLTSTVAFAQFINEDFVFYSGWYARIREAAAALTEGLETIHFNAQNNFTLQYPVLLASLRQDDGEGEILRKLRVVSGYLDILIARRIWNWKSTSYSAMQYGVFQRVIREVRGAAAADLAAILQSRLDEEEFFSANDRFSLHSRNGPQIHRLLARMTDFVEIQSGRASHYADYVRGGNKGYEIEHIWADQHDRHRDEFPHPQDFADYRNRIGGLLLLPKSFNASYGDMGYARKREHYYGQNLLAQSLHERAYENDPGFSQFIDQTGICFRAHPEFKKADLDARQKLYLDLAARIWNPDNLQQEVNR